MTRLSSTLFIGKVLDLLQQRSGQPLEQIARAKYRILDALEKVIGQHRAERQTSAYRRALLPQSGLAFETSSRTKDPAAGWLAGPAATCLASAACGPIWGGGISWSCRCSRRPACWP